VSKDKATLLSLRTDFWQVANQSASLKKRDSNDRASYRGAGGSILCESYFSAYLLDFAAVTVTVEE